MPTNEAHTQMIAEAVTKGSIYEPFERAAAAARMRATQGNKQTGSENFSEPEKGESLDKVAAAVGTRKSEESKGQNGGLKSFTQDTADLMWVTSFHITSATRGRNNRAVCVLGRCNASNSRFVPRAR